MNNLSSTNCRAAAAGVGKRQPVRRLIHPLSGFSLATGNDIGILDAAV
jgi:hypothetical protein